MYTFKYQGTLELRVDSQQYGWKLVWYSFCLDHHALQPPICLKCISSLIISFLIPTQSIHEAAVIKPILGPRRLTSAHNPVSSFLFSPSPCLNLRHNPGLIAKAPESPHAVNAWMPSSLVSHIPWPTSYTDILSEITSKSHCPTPLFSFLSISRLGFSRKRTHLTHGARAAALLLISTHYRTSDKSGCREVKASVPPCETASSLAADLSPDHLSSPQRLRQTHSTMVVTEKSSLGGKD